MTTTDVKRCPHCSENIPFEDIYCSFCGEEIKTLSPEERKKIRRAAKWILALSILFVIFGTIFGFMQKSKAEEAKQNLAQFEDSYVFDTPINGKYYTVGELKTKIDQEVLLLV